MSSQHSFPVLGDESNSFLWPQEMPQWPYPSAGALLCLLTVPHQLSLVPWD